MSGLKASLKAIGAAIKAQKYDVAAQESQKILQTDPKSYQASIFLGFALSKQSKYADAEQAYQNAISIKESDPQAWQGLIQVYEKQSSDKVAAYQIAALKLAEIYKDADEKYKCQDVIDKFLIFAKSQGSRLQNKEAQRTVLPTSPIYNYLEGRIPHPAHTYQIMAQITEFEEKERINKDIGERRTRLGAKIGQVTTEVKQEVMRDSDIEELYAEIIDWSNDDDIRRQYEEKLLQRCVDAMAVLKPGKGKSEKRDKAMKLASDMVIIKHPYKLAWDIALEWTDPKDVQELDSNVLHEYCSFFPTSGLGQLLRGFLDCEISPFPPRPPTISPAQPVSDESEDDDDEGGGVVLNSPINPEDRLLIMTEGMSDTPRSLIAHRIMGEYYQFLEEYEVSVELMRNGRRLIAEESSRTGQSFHNASASITAILATALVFYQSPRNHPEAKILFDELLQHENDSEAALIGIGLIHEEEEDYSSAIDFLGRALLRNPSNVRVKSEAAWVKALNGDYATGREELESVLALIEAKDTRSRDLLAQTQYRVGVCIWHTDTSKIARKDRLGAYSWFLASLKSNLNFAPAYTSLGIFYADYLKDKKRARKCFQKAFELSASEVEAAERLARMFAQQKEWELVEIVAQRVVDSGKVRPSPGSKKRGISWPFAALGVAELNKQDYAKSVVSFQSALRLAPNDYHSWVGLGESYLNSGRYIAATKAFQHAEKFEDTIKQQGNGETWYAKYMLANVKRELGDYDEAISGYQEVLNYQPSEFGVTIAMIQALIESAWDGVEKGLFGHAVERASEAIDAALAIAESRADTFNLWRAVGDACAVFSWVQSRVKDFPSQKVRQLLETVGEEQSYELFTSIDGVGIDVVCADGLYPEEEEEGLILTRAFHASILAHKRAIHASAHDVHAEAVAYYNLGWAERRAHLCLSDRLKKRSTRYLKASIRCFKRAIELEAGNHEFWNALGVVTSELNPKVALHSFVRSLFLNERNAQTWTNLGSLCLLQNDFALANEAFARAQSSDPSFGLAWVGQGVLALLLTGDTKEANLLFTHAMEISDSSILVTKRCYSQSVLDRILASKSNSNVDDHIGPLFALNQLLSIVPGDLVHRHLSTLFCERMDDLPSAVSTLTNICSAVEEDYEVTESPSSLSRFALAKADLARLQLADRQYHKAIENGEVALQLSAEDAGNELSAESRKVCRLSAHLTVGLAHHYLQETTEALQYFLPALEESNRNPDANCLFAQVLWAEGNEKSKAMAQETLFDSVENNPNHIQSIILLAIIALLDDDAESLDAATASLRDLRATHNLSDQEQGRVGEVLRAIAALSDSPEQAILAELQADIFLHPSQSHGWGRLSAIEGDEHSAAFALRNALKNVPPKGQVIAEDLASSFAGTGKPGDAQVSVMLAPWETTGWAGLNAAIVAAR